MRKHLLLASLLGSTLACESSSVMTTDAGDTNETGEGTGNGEAGEGTGDTGDVGSEPCEPSAYTVTIDGEAIPVERVCKFAVPVNYVHLSHSGSPMQVEVATAEPLSEYTLSPTSKGITPTASGNTLSWTLEEPAYLILESAGAERFFLLVDPPEEDPPQLGDPEVVNVAELEGMDATGETEVTEIVQSAIDAASGSERNVLYFPPGTYATKALYLKDDVTLYLAQGALLQNVTEKRNLLGPMEGLANIEGSPAGYIVMDGVRNAKILGRGTLDGNGAALQEGSRKKSFLLKIEDSSDCVVDGILSRDSSFWNTMIYRSDGISISNYKVINNQLANDYNETDGVDYNNSTNSTLKNAFLYVGDDCMAVKADDIPDDLDVSGIADPTVSDEYINVDNLVHEGIVCHTRAAACKVGTKTFGDSMSGIVFRDVDVVRALRGLVIDAVDTATITGTVFEDIRVEEVTGNLVDFNMDPQMITWRVNLGIASVSDVTVKDVASDVTATVLVKGNIHDWDEADPYYGEEYFIDGVAFTNFSVEGTVITDPADLGDTFQTNEYATNVTFAAE